MDNSKAAPLLAAMLVGGLLGGGVRAQLSPPLPQTGSIKLVSFDDRGGADVSVAYTVGGARGAANVHCDADGAQLYGAPYDKGATLCGYALSFARNGTAAAAGMIPDVVSLAPTSYAPPRAITPFRKTADRPVK